MVICVCVCVGVQMSVWVSNRASVTSTPCLTVFLSDPLRQEQEGDRRTGGEEEREEEGEKNAGEETWKTISGAPEGFNEEIRA